MRVLFEIVLATLHRDHPLGLRRPIVFHPWFNPDQRLLDEPSPAYETALDEANGTAEKSSAGNGGGIGAGSAVGCPPENEPVSSYAAGWNCIVG